MKKRLFCMMLVLFMVLPLLSAPVEAEDGIVTVSIAGTEDHDAAAELCQAINDFRAAGGTPALTQNAALTELAMIRAAEIAVNYNTAQRPDGSYLDTLFEELSGDWTVLVAAHGIGPETASEMVRKWDMNNDTYATMKTPNATQIGAGCFMANGVRTWVIFLGHDASNSAPDQPLNPESGVKTVVHTLGVYPGMLNFWPQGEKVIEIDWGKSASFKIFSRNNVEFRCQPAMIPIVTDAVNLQGEVIAKITVSDTDPGLIVITPEKAGSGYAPVYIYEGQKFPLMVYVVFPGFEVERLPEGPLPNTSASGVWGDHLRWNLEMGVLTISGEGPMDLAIPGSDEYPWRKYSKIVKKVVVEEGVTSINENAFSWFNALTELALPNTLESIGKMAFFNCTELMTVEIPDSVLELGEQAFGMCTALESIHLPSGLTQISAGLLDHTAIREISIPDTVTALGSGAFQGCTNLVSVVIPEGVQELPEACFDFCSALTSVQIPESVTAIYDNCFRFCGSLAAVDLPDGLTYIGQFAFANSGLKQITIPDSVTKLENYTFSHCMSLEEIKLPAQMEKIGWYCFERTSSLKTIELPQGLTEIPQGCFSYSGLESIVLPYGVWNISHYAFEECQSLSAVVIPDTVTQILATSFQNCPNLTVGCYAMSYTHLFALEQELPYVLMEEVPTTPLYPISVYGNEGGTVNLSTEYSPANRYVLVQIVPDDTHVFAAMRYYRADGSEEDLPYLDLGNDQYLIFMPYSELMLDVTFLMKNVPFADVPESQYYYLPVLWAVSEGITAGTDATHFSPDASCTRAQIVTFLWRTAGEPEPVGTDNPFVDVKPGDYYYKAVLWAAENGITSGMDATHFRPELGCTRAQVVTFLWRACGKPSYNAVNRHLIDVPEGAYYYDAVMWASEFGITSGVSADSFAPDRTCTRAQIVTFLFRAFF